MKLYKAPAILILVFVLQTMIHYFIAMKLELAPEKFFTIYGFMFIITLIVILIIELSNLVLKEQLGFIFLGIIVFKLLAAFLFLKMANINQSPDKYHFLFAYLILIIVLVFYVAEKLLHTDKKH